MADEKPKQSESRGSGSGRIIERVLALAGVVILAIVIWMVVSNGIDAINSDEGDRNGETTTEEEVQRTNDRTYVVQPGDNFEVISQQTGIPVDELLMLNPEVDARTLQAGYELQLR